MTRPSIEFTARNIAIAAHGGDRNKHDGEIYLLHVSRVAQGARERIYGYGPSASLLEATGWLHDVVEDTAVTLLDIQRAFEAAWPKLDHTEMLTAIDLLTKKPGTVLEDYYWRILGSELATRVKRADMQDNFSRNHLITDPETAARMAKKYSLGMSILGG